MGTELAFTYEDALSAPGLLFSIFSASGNGCKPRPTHAGLGHPKGPVCADDSASTLQRHYVVACMGGEAHRTSLSLCEDVTCTGCVLVVCGDTLLALCRATCCQAPQMAPPKCGSLARTLALEQYWTRSLLTAILQMPLLHQLALT